MKWLESGPKMAWAMTYQVTEYVRSEKKKAGLKKRTGGALPIQRNGGWCAILVFAFPAGFANKGRIHVKKSWHKVRRNYD